MNRTDVVDIYHPGKIRLTIGSMVVAAGTAMLIYGLVRKSCTVGPGESCEGAGVDKLLLIQGGVGAILGGGALALAGWFAYDDSTTAAEPSPAIPSAQAMRHSLSRLTCSFCSHYESGGMPVDRSWTQSNKPKDCQLSVDEGGLQPRQCYHRP